MPRLRADSLSLTILLGAITALTPMAMDIYLVSLPSLAGEFATDAGSTQLTFSVYLIGNAVGQIWLGSLSDRVGRRPVLLGGIAIFCCASVACALAPTIKVLIVARFVQGLGICAGQVVCRAVVRDCYSRERAAQVLSLMALLTGLAPILAPVIGSHLHAWAGWRTSFIFVSAYGVAVFLVVLFGLPESLEHRDPEALRPRRMLMNFRTALANRAFVGYVVTSCAMSAGLMIFLSSGPFVFIGAFGYDERGFGFLLSLVMLSNIVGAFVGSRVVRRVGIDTMVAAGTLGALIAGLAALVLALAGASTVPAVVAPVMVFLFSFALVMPQALAGALAPFPHMAGAASSLLGFLGLATSAIVGATVGAAFDGTQMPMAIGLAIMGCIAFAAHRMLTPRVAPAAA